MIKLILLFLLLSNSINCSRVAWQSVTNVSQCQPCPMNFFNTNAGLSSAGLIIQGSTTVTTVIQLPSQATLPNTNGTFTFTLNVPAGTNASVQVIDTAGVTSQSSFTTVKISETSDCLADLINSGTSTVIPSSTVTAVGAITGSTVKKSNSLSGGAIAGIVIGSVIGGLLIGSALYYLLRKRNKNHHPDSSTSSDPVLNDPNYNNTSSSSPPFTSMAYSNSPSTTGHGGHNSYYSSQPTSPLSQTSFQNNNNGNRISSNGTTTGTGIGGIVGTNDLDDPQRFNYRMGTNTAAGGGYAENVENSGSGSGGVGGGRSSARFPPEGME